jgi:hypothetical protein
MRSRLLLAACGLAVVIGMLWLVPAASPTETFNKEFKSCYVRPRGDRKAVAFATAVDKARCSVCHLGGKKKGFNAYGKQVAKLLHKSDERDRKKILAALNKVAAMKINPSDSKSQSFGERIRQGKLPAGTD